MAITQAQLTAAKKDSDQKYQVYMDNVNQYNTAINSYQGMDKYNGNKQNGVYVAENSWFSLNTGNCGGIATGCKTSVNLINSNIISQLRGAYSDYQAAEQKYQQLLAQYKAEGEGQIIEAKGEQLEAEAWLKKYGNFILAAIAVIAFVWLGFYVYKKFIKK